MKRISVSIAVFFALTLAYGQAGLNDGRVSPRLLNYQGYLTDTLGTPITNPSVSMTFSIYDAVSAGNQKWTETQGSVGVDKGIFHVLLGGVAVIPDSVFNAGIDRWLELSIGGQALNPRTRIVSVPYAYSATYSDTALYAMNSTSDIDWNFLISDGADTTLQMGGRWGIARPGNTLYGNADSTHVNLGVGGTTGTNGQNYKYITVSGGLENIASNRYTTIGGGTNNSANDQYATVGGGTHNSAGFVSTIGGGWYNTAGNSSSVGGGQLNSATSYGAISGGMGNIASGFFSTISGGGYNRARGQFSVVGGGGVTSNVNPDSNSANGNYSVIGGGYSNIASGIASVIGGGYNNANSGDYSVIPGGYADSIAAGASYSYLFGINSNLTQDSTFMVDLPHVWFGTEANGYEFPTADGAADQVMVTDGSGKLSWGSTNDNDWSFLISDGADTTLQMGGLWGIARAGNTLYGNADSTHVNLGVACTTGTTGSGFKYTTIAGGLGNSARNDYATVSGGYQNRATNNYAAVGGGIQNTASGWVATVGGGVSNQASNEYATVSGGSVNTASGIYAVVGGGRANKARGQYAVVGGGGSATEADSNSAIGDWSAIGGGHRNIAGGNSAVIGGGRQNTSSNWYAIVGGGQNNTASGQYATVGGGEANTASAHRATVAGGAVNQVTGEYSAILGGYANTIAATGDYSYLFGINSNLTQDSTFMVDMPHVWFGTEANGYEFPNGRGTDGQVMKTNGSGILSWGAIAYVDSARVAANTYKLQGKDTADFNVDYVNEDQVNSITNAMLQDDAVTTDKIADTSVTMPKIAPAGATAGQVIKWNGTAWQPGADSSMDSDWNFRITDGADTTLQTGGRWGIARAGNTLYGNADSTHVNLGVGSTTGTNGQNNKYCTVGGGQNNTASGNQATVGGGRYNKARGLYSVVSGGGAPNESDSNSAIGDYSVIGGGLRNRINGAYATIGGGFNNVANGYVGTVAGGSTNAASGYIATVGGGSENIASSFLATVSGGSHNTASDTNAIVGGGYYNYAGGKYSAILGGYADTITATGDFSYLFGINSNLTQDSTFMVDLPHVWFGTEANGYEFPYGRGTDGQVMKLNGSGILSWGSIAYVDSARVAANAHKLQGKDTVDFNVDYVNEGQVNSITNAMIQDGAVMTFKIADTAVTMPKIAPAGAVAGQVIKWNGTAWQPSADSSMDNDWNYLVSDGADTTLQMGGQWGLARPGNVLFGNGDSTHVNFGVSCTTGTNGQNYRYCTVAGGRNNLAGGGFSATVSGGDYNKANGNRATVGGGQRNTASGMCATVSGGTFNTASNWYATVGGGEQNGAGNQYSTVGGGRQNTANGWIATVAGGWGNTASNERATVGGGEGNTANNQYSTVGGGQTNMASGMHATVAGGRENTASGYAAIVSGGWHNTAGGYGSAVGGGTLNNAGVDYTFIGSGHTNYSAGYYSAILGGYADTIFTGANYSYLFGINSNLTQDSTFMVDMPHVWFGTEANGYEFPYGRGTDGQVMKTNGSGILSWGAIAYVDSARVAANTYKLQGKDTADFNVDYVNEDQVNSITNAMLQDDAVTTDKIADTSVTMPKIAPAGATAGQVIKWNGTAWQPAVDSSMDSDWSYRITDGADTTLQTGGRWGIARYGNVLFGNADSTHVNLGVASTTGAGGWNSKYSTVGGGYSNAASTDYSTVSGGSSNNAGGSFGLFAAVGGGANNTASGWWAYVGGGSNNTANAECATVSGGRFNSAVDTCVFIGGGYQNNVAGEYSAILGGRGNTITASGSYSYLSGINSNLTQDSTFMVDLPHIRFGTEAAGYEFPITDGSSGQALITNGSGQVSWGTPAMRTTYTPTSSADANGNVGDIAWDDGYVYVKTSAGWKRSALSTW